MEETPNKYLLTDWVNEWVSLTYTNSFQIFFAFFFFLNKPSLKKNKPIIPQSTKWRREELLWTSVVPLSHLLGTSGLGDTARKTNDLHKLKLSSFALKATYHHSKPTSALSSISSLPHAHPYQSI